MQSKPNRNFKPQKTLSVMDAVKKAGGVTQLSYLLGISTQAVYSWGEFVPVKRENELRKIWSSQGKKV